MLTREKNRIDDLAALGGPPLFDEPRHVGRPNLPERGAFLRRINEIFDRRWLTNKGPFVTEMEGRVADYLGVKHCVAVCSGTAALEIACKALGLKGEVICPSFTFVATAHALEWLGLRPVFCDVDPKTHNIDPARAKELITAKTSAIVGVHLWGRPCAVEALASLAEKHRLKLLFDAAHAFGATLGGRFIGGFGAAEVFSFHATKVFNTFEGGAVTTNDGELAGRCRLLKNFGFKGYDTVLSAGINGKMSEVHAAMGLALLESLPRILEENRERYRVYQKTLGGVDGLRLVTYDEGEENNFQYVTVEVDPETAGLSRNQVLGLLTAENILARRYFHPGCHRLPPHTLDPSIDRSRLAQTEMLCARVLCLPAGAALDLEDAGAIGRLLAFIIANRRPLARRLAEKKGA
jgi:dTDP-4-amino-4,6-dideoxygalactose transaminase